MNQNNIIKEELLPILKDYHSDSNEIQRYFSKESFDLPDKFLQSEKVFEGKAPELKIPKRTIFNLRKTAGDSHNKDDLENAIKLYESMKLNRVQASDARLYAYLCHGPYYEFVRTRYSPNKKFKDYEVANFYNEKKEIQTTIKNYITNKFFINNNRSLVDNGIASLWWACEFTHSPWEKYSTIKKNNKDKYHYTEIILSKPDIYQQVFERTYGRETPLIFHLLDFIIDNNLGRSEYRPLVISLNSQLAFNVFSNQSEDAIKSNFSKLMKT
jgi:hypothetical protein